MDNEITRVLHIVGIMNRGGIETFIMNVYRNLDRRMIQFDFLIGRVESGDYDDEIRTLGGIIYNLEHITKVGVMKYRKQVADFFLKHSYGIVHCHMNSWSGFYLPIAKKVGVDVTIAHSHSTQNNYRLNGIRKYLFKQYNQLFINKHSDIRLACSQASGDWLFGKNKQYKVLWNGIDTQQFKHCKQLERSLRKEHNVQEDTFVVGHVGSFSYPKNHLFLIDIFYHIQIKNQHSLLILIGEGTMKEEVEHRVKQLGIQHKVMFMGKRTDVDRLLNMFNVLVMPSRYEGFPVSTIEAQSAGVPCVLSSNITREVVILEDNVELISLKESPEKWGDRVLKYKNTIKQEGYANEIVKRQGFNINDVSKILTELYLNHHKKIGE